MKKICIVCVSGLPIPAIKGGAIETLVEHIINENEKNPQYKSPISYYTPYNV